MDTKNKRSALGSAWLLLRVNIIYSYSTPEGVEQTRSAKKEHGGTSYLGEFETCFFPRDCCVPVAVEVLVETNVSGAPGCAVERGRSEHVYVVQIPSVITPTF